MNVEEDSVGNLFEQFLLNDPALAAEDDKKNSLPPGIHLAKDAPHTETRIRVVGGLGGGGRLSPQLTQPPGLAAGAAPAVTAPKPPAELVALAPFEHAPIDR